MAGKFKVISTEPFTYIGPAGQPVNGFRVMYEITQFGETHFALVKSLDEREVKPAIEALIAAREALARLT